MRVYQVAADFLSRASSPAGVVVAEYDDYLAERSLMVMDVYSGVSRDVFERYVKGINFEPGKVVNITFADLHFAAAEFSEADTPQVYPTY